MPRSILRETATPLAALADRRRGLPRPCQVYLDLDWNQPGYAPPTPYSCGLPGYGEECIGHFVAKTNYTLWVVAVNAFGAGPVSPPLYVLTGQ